MAQLFALLTSIKGDVRAPLKALYSIRDRGLITIDPVVNGLYQYAKRGVHLTPTGKALVAAAIPPECPSTSCASTVEPAFEWLTEKNGSSSGTATEAYGNDNNGT